ncbi:antibiotic biosynthesis monooxygenase [Nocardioides jiangsuensis]|uniref:antibiotic biosynthesis monooxygenase n=1 Tax=Nocardioides jiangsuensis TaxID=2866161 RepID=UPI0027E2F809|nr:antibiotic biosynthesis monooxygenase [Nocardioides jiangsuensis]
MTISTHPDVAVPVTVSITRHVDPEHTEQMTAWVRAGTSLAERFPGFLGTGWVRPGGRSDEWHMLYRFDSPESLARWEASEQRAWWLGSAQGLVGESRRERRTGIEGWFDPPQEHDVEDLRALPGAPPRWKQAVMIWTAFFPLSLAMSALLGVVAPDLALVPRALLTTVVMTPIMTYLVLPQLTSRLDWWLHGRPAPWRR